MTDVSVKEELEEWLSNAIKVVIAGIGNPLRMDDSVGVKIVRDLQGKVSKNVMLIECETVPESFLQQIMDFKPSHVLIVDAAVMGLMPGECKFVKPEHLQVLPATSTHALPLKIFCDYLAEVAGAKVALLLIEPKNVDFGEGLSEEVEVASRKITDFLTKILP
jgi:hydrogenase 3 maturation protease